MALETLTITRLADLRFGDRIKSWDGNTYTGSPVRGVRLENPNPDSTLEYVLYPSQMDGRGLEVERYIV